MDPDNTLTAQALLQTWEQVQGQHPLRRSLALLQAAWPEAQPQPWGTLPIGERDSGLLTLYESLFGPELDTLAACPACSEPLQMRFATHDMRPPPAQPRVAEEAGQAGLRALNFDGYAIGWRLPSSDDLLGVIDTDHGTPEAAVAGLLQRCVIDAQHQGQPAVAADLPLPVIDRLQQEMAACDPGADMRVTLSCPACGHAFERRFDIGGYLWDALDDWAQRTLAEVHALAGAYGWSEPQVLALSATRRQHYIGLVQG